MYDKIIRYTAEYYDLEGEYFLWLDGLTDETESLTISEYAKQYKGIIII